LDKPREEVHPLEDQLEYLEHEVEDGGDIGFSAELVERDQGVHVEVELSPHRLRKFLGRWEVAEVLLDHLLHLPHELPIKPNEGLPCYDKYSLS